MPFFPIITTYCLHELLRSIWKLSCWHFFSGGFGNGLLLNNNWCYGCAFCAQLLCPSHNPPFRLAKRNMKLLSHSMFFGGFGNGLLHRRTYDARAVSARLPCPSHNPPFCQPAICPSRISFPLRKAPQVFGIVLFFYFSGTD